MASIIIVGWRKAPLLLDCLQSLMDAELALGYEVIVALNEPTDELTNRLATRVRGARIEVVNANLGFGGAVNNAAQLARGDYIALLNDDCTVTPGWLEELHSLLVRRPAAGIVGSTFLYPDGRVQEVGSVLWRNGHTAPVGDGEAESTLMFERRVDYCSGASLLIRRELWDLLGGFDDAYYPAYHEDLDLCLRAAQNGWEVWFSPTSVVYHVKSASTHYRFRDFLVARTKAAFYARWMELLAFRTEPYAPRETSVWMAMGYPIRVLIVSDETTGLRPQTDRLVREISQLDGVHLAVQLDQPEDVTFDAARAGVRIVKDLGDHLATPGVEYDLAFFDGDVIPEQVQSLVPAAQVITDADVVRQAIDQARSAGYGTPLQAWQEGQLFSAAEAGTAVEVPAADQPPAKLALELEGCRRDLQVKSHFIAMLEQELAQAQAQIDDANARVADALASAAAAERATDEAHTEVRKQETRLQSYQAELSLERSRRSRLAVDRVIRGIKSLPGGRLLLRAVLKRGK